MSAPTPEQWDNPAAAPSESDAFLSSEQDVLEDALSYAVSTLVLTKARGKKGPDAVLDLAERLQEYASYIRSGGDTKGRPRVEAWAPVESPLPPPKETNPPAKIDETPPLETMEWSAFKWLHGNHSVDRAIIDVLKSSGGERAAGKSTGDADLAFCQGLCDGGVERIKDMLTKGDVVGELAERIFAAAKRLKDGNSKEGSGGGQKFSSTVDGVTLSLGKLATFYSGLEAFIGPPKLHMAEAMKFEHCKGKDADAELIALNYKTYTTSRIEYLFVTAPTEASLEKLKIKEWPPDQRLTRSQKKGAEREAELNEDTLRGAMPRKATSIEEFRPVLNMRNEQLRQLDQPPLRDDEFYAARLYTGPMYLKYNAALRHKGMMNSDDAPASSKEHSEAQFQQLCMGNYYVSTLHAINSAVVKLGKLAKAQKVYRGISNRALSQELLEPNEYNVRGGVEFAFMSTTPKRGVAMEYAGKGADHQTSIVFEIKMGMIDRGADISWLSQYPHEEERLFPPLTALSIEDDVVVEDDISMFKVRLNVNLLAMTLEQMDGKMHRSHLSMIDLLTDELKFANIPSKLVAPLRYLKNRVENRDPADFTDVDEFQKATVEALAVQQEIFDELCTGSSLESEIRKEEQLEEQEKKARQESQRRGSNITAVVQERCEKAFKNAARVAAGAGSKGQSPAATMLRKSFKGQNRDPKVEELLQKHKVSMANQGILDVLWLLIFQFRVDQPWPSVIVEIFRELQEKAEHAEFSRTLDAFTELLAGWVKEETKRVEEEAVSKGTLLAVYDKDNKQWARARLTGESKPNEGSAAVTLVEASRGNLAAPLWVEKDKHVVYPGYDGAGALLFEAVKSEQMPLIKAILEAGVSVFSFDRDWSTAILKAAKGGKLDACKLLTERGADAHLFNKNRQNAFDAATLGRHTDCLRLLQPTDPDKQAADPEANKLTPLMEACHRGDHEQVEALLGTAEPDAETEPPDKQGKAQPKLSALAFAANLGDTTIVEKLLERAPQETHLFSALMLAARSGNETLARLLLNHSPGLAKMADDKVNLAIHKAALAGHDKVLNLLLTHDADATAANHFDETPLMMATRFGHSSTTALLLRNRADKNRSDGTGWTCLMRAAGNGHTKVVVELLKGSSDPLHVDAQDKKHATTALMAACKSGQLDTASLLLDHDANTLLQDSNGRTALHHSASAGHDLVVKALLQQPDEVVKELAACTDARHMTPLMLACEHGCEGAVRLLLGPKKACADNVVVKGREGDGYTALMIAVDQGHKEVVRVILQQSKSDVHQVAEDGETTAFSLAKKNRDEVVLKLLHQVRTVLFQSHQQTKVAYDAWHRWLRGREPESLKVSLPPFNEPKTITLLPMTKKYDVPNFGVMIPKAVMPLFEGDEIKALATELNIRIPQYMLDSFVQKKMFKVKVLVQAARDLGGCDEQADRLERFATAFENLAVDEIRGPDEWKRFVEGHVAAGWESRLHFDHVLQNFGFDIDAAKRLRGTKHTEIDPKSGEETTQDLETFSFRWLGKAFSGYSVKGCLTDVVNLVFAMAELYGDGKDPKKLAESEIARKITEVVTKVNKGDLSGLWVPTHIVHDSESDDLLCWLLLEHIHKKLGSDLQVLVQFPPSAAADLQEYVQKMSERKNVTFFRDRDSKNEKAVRGALGLPLPK